MSGNQVLLNDGSGIFIEPEDQPPGTQFSFDVALGDLDGDGGVPPADEYGLPNIDQDGRLPSMYVDTIV